MKQKDQILILCLFTGLGCLARGQDDPVETPASKRFFSNSHRDFSEQAETGRQELLARLSEQPFSIAEDFFSSEGNYYSKVCKRMPVAVPSDLGRGRFMIGPDPESVLSGSWKCGIVTTVFWVGEPSAENNPVSNDRSAWNTHWRSAFGGLDDPERRVGFLPFGFVPRQNPFYIALPYNDQVPGGYRPEAPEVVPWFKEAFQKNPGNSTIQGHWVAIRNRQGRICYAQWEDVGPFQVDHWAYVFANERPRPNRNGGAGLDVSPAVRDYLGLNGLDVTDWRFVDESQVPNGPWRWAFKAELDLAARKDSDLPAIDSEFR